MLRVIIPIRPPFKKVSPMVYVSAWAFALLNLLFLAPAFFYGPGATGLSLVSFVPSKLWGVIFASMGVTMIYALIINWWQLIKQIFLVGLFIKAMFAWALFFTLTASIANIGIVGVWLALMTWQALCVIYFTPIIGDKHGSNK